MIENRAQGSIEYLLIIGAAIIVVSVVIITISGVLTQTKKSIDSNDVNDQMNNLKGLKK